MLLPKIKMAQQLAKALQADGVIVLAFSQAEARIAGASYGADKKLCETYGRFLDAIIDSATLSGLEGKVVEPWGRTRAD